MSQEELITKIFEEKFGKSKISANGKVNGYLNLYGYKHPLPNSIINTGDLDLRVYNHHLPDSITSTGYLYLSRYNYPLPNSITSINGSYLFLRDYNHPLPNSIKTINGHIWVDNNYTGLPDNFHEWKILGRINYYI